MLTFQLNKKTVIIATLVAALLLLFPLVVFGQYDINDPIQKLLWTIVNVLFGWFVWVGGMLLDTAITSYVVGFGDQFRDTGLGFAVHALWTMVRDFFNLFFIFGLVYIGFKMILNSGDSKARHMLAGIVMAGLLVNFSLFFTKFIVDFSNVMATQLAGAFSTTTGNYEAAASFANVLGITSLFSTGGPEGLNAIYAGGGYAYIFGTMILYLILGFVLAAGGLLLMIRFVVLNIYMILSPVMFLGWVFPGMASLSQTYWKGFLKRAFFAPAYLMMLYFAFFVTNEFTVATSRKSFADLFISADTAGSSFATTIPFFIIICGFLVAAILVAQKMGVEGANMSVNLGKKMAGRAGKAAGGMTFGAAGRVGRGTFGSLGSAATNNNNRFGKRLNTIAEGSGLRAWAARRAQDTANVAATSSYDTRNIGGAGKALGLGEGKTGGYNKDTEERIKAEKARAKKYAYNDQAYDDNGVKSEFEEYNDLVAERKEKFEELASSDNEIEREALTIHLSHIQSEINAMEDGKVSDTFTGSEDELGKRQQQLNKFKQARAQAKANYGQRLYAANLETRYDGIPLIGGLLSSIGGQQRSAAAAAINQEAGRNPTERLIKDLLDKDKDGDNKPQTGGPDPESKP